MQKIQERVKKKINKRRDIDSDRFRSKRKRKNIEKYRNNLGKQSKRQEKCMHKIESETWSV